MASRLRNPDSATGHALPGADLPWEEWVRGKFPHVTRFPFGSRHRRLWDWFDSLLPGVRPKPRVEVWPRGGAKSSTAELCCSWLGVKLSRRFVLYVSETQEQADKHVQAIASCFETLGVERAVNQYGNSRGWKRDQLRTANGFNVAALGLDTAARGIKLDQFRPDIIVFDDIDGRHDSAATTKKKIEAITETIIPAGSADCALLFLQNLIIKTGIVAQLVDGTADFLLNRDVPPIEPAVIGLTYRQEMGEDGLMVYRITGGEPTWEGQNIATCQEQFNDWGRRAFLREAMHRVDLEEGGLWNRERDIDPHRKTYADLPPLLRVGVGVDPTASSAGDEAGIVTAGVGMVNGVLHGFVLEDASRGGSPREWADASVTTFHRNKGDCIVAEKNNGGEMVEVTISTVKGAPPVKLVHASRGKITRAEPVQKLYEDGRVHHVGKFEKLEGECCSYKPGDASPNRMDALVWILTELMLGGGDWGEMEHTEDETEDRQELSEAAMVNW